MTTGAMLRFGLALLLLIGCGHARRPDGEQSDADTGGGRHDAATSGDSGTGNTDATTGTDASGHDDATIGMDASGGVITGGPCMSGQPGATAYRIRWANGGGTAYPVYEVNGLPDHSRDHTGAYGYVIGFTAQYVDPFLGEGGVQLDGSDFIDIELSTVGLSQISHTSLSIYGRSFNTTASGSFNWMTFVDAGETPTNSVSNAAPYQWYAGDMTSAITSGDHGVLLRIKAGPSSDALVVNRIELCMQAN